MKSGGTPAWLLVEVLTTPHNENLQRSKHFTGLWTCVELGFSH
jgi:hypothetical protein